MLARLQRTLMCAPTYVPVHACTYTHRASNGSSLEEGEEAHKRGSSRSAAKPSSRTKDGMEVDDDRYQGVCGCFVCVCVCVCV